MTDPRKCPKCGGAMPPDGLEGLCPRCLARVVFGHSEQRKERTEEEGGPPAVGDEAERSATPGAREAAMLNAEVAARLELEATGGRIGRYKLLEKIGEGGFGVVYMAEQVEPVHRQVALKIIKAGMDTRQVIARFEAERQALALMDHPNIARVLDGGTTQTGRPYFVMDLVRGIPITDYCDQCEISTTERLVLFVKVCHAVQHAHQKGIIHRDLKPSNVLATLHDGEPVPKVIDFGVAKALSQRLTEKTLYTGFGEMIGTPAYMSPEQAEISGLDVDTRSDIYSLGVLLYELLTGVTPFDKETMAKAGLDEIRRLIRETPPPKPSTRLRRLGLKAAGIAQNRRTDLKALRRLVRGDLDWVVMKCLEKDRARRYETANSLALDVQHYLNNEPVLARPPSRIYRFRKLVRRNKLLFAAIGFVGLALLLGLGVSTWLWRKERAARRVQTQLRQQALAQERKALTEAEKSRQVAQFLKDMLEGVGPSVAMGRDTKLLQEILDKTAERIGNDLTNQPEVEAQLRTTLGELYRVLGRFDQSEQMHQQALGIQKQLFPRDHADVALSMNDLALVLIEERKLDESEALTRDALEMRRRLLGNKHRQVGESLVSLGVLLHHRAKLAEAEAVQREALALWREVLGNECGETATTLNSLALVLRDQGRLAEAEAMQREALEIQRKVLGPKHPHVATSLNNLAVLLNSQGKLPAAEATHREALALMIELYGTNHANVAVSLNCLAIVLSAEGQHAEAEAKHRQALDLQTKLLGDQHPDVAISLNNLAGVLLALRKPAEAEALYRRAQAIFEKVLGKKHPNVATTMNNLGRALREQGKLAEAETMQRDALALRLEVLPAEHPAIAISLTDLAIVLRDQGKWAEAESRHREALALRIKKLGNNDPAVALSREHLARLLAEQGRSAEAEPLARECLEQREKKAPDDWRTSYTRCLLGVILLGQKKTTDAEPLLVAACEKLLPQKERLSADQQQLLREALRSLVQLLEDTDRPGAAAPWRERLALLGPIASPN
jgi:eukaryotic-like serine/threonine-protein kinase